MFNLSQFAVVFISVCASFHQILDCVQQVIDSVLQGGHAFGEFGVTSKRLASYLAGQLDAIGSQLGVCLRLTFGFHGNGGSGCQWVAG